MGIDHARPDIAVTQLAACSAHDVANPFEKLAELKVVLMSTEDHLHAMLLEGQEEVHQRDRRRAVPWARVKRRVMEVWNFPRHLGLCEILLQPFMLFPVFQVDRLGWPRFGIKSAVQREEVGQSS